MKRRHDVAVSDSERIGLPLKEKRIPKTRKTRANSAQHKQEAERIRRNYVVRNTSSSDDDFSDDTDYGDVGEIFVRVPRTTIAPIRKAPKRQPPRKVKNDAYTV